MDGGRSSMRERRVVAPKTRVGFSPVTPLCGHCAHWGPLNKEGERGWGYCYLADWHNPHKKLFFAEPSDSAKDARLKTYERFGCIVFQKKWEGEQ